MKYFLVLSLLLAASFSMAQDSLNLKQPGKNKFFTAKLKGQAYVGMTRIAGREFLYDYYLQGDVLLENGKVAYNQMLKYNGRIDGLILHPRNTGIEILLDKYFIKGFSLKDSALNKTLNFRKIKIGGDFGGDSTLIYAQELYAGKFSLYAYRRYIYLNDVIDMVGNETIARRLFVPSIVYYFKLPNNRTIGFTTFKKRSLYKLFPNNKELMRKIFKEKHQRRFKTEDDLINITEMLNPLYQ